MGIDRVLAQKDRLEAILCILKKQVVQGANNPNLSDAEHVLITTF